VVNLTGSPTKIRSTDGTGDVIDVLNVDTVEVHHTVELNNDGGGESLVGTKTSVAGDVVLGIKSLTEGTNINFDVTATNITINSTGGAGCQQFTQESTATLSTTSTTFQTVHTFVAETEIQNGEVWQLTVFNHVCHPPNVFAINTNVRWQIETAPAVWSTFASYQVAWPISILPGETSCPATVIREITAQMDTPRFRMQVRVTSVGLATGTFVENPRVWGSLCG
jgi:hypothetical protein